jgi:hypothetical protein
MKKQREMNDVHERSRTFDRTIRFILGAHFLVYTLVFNATPVVASSLSLDKVADAFQSAHIIDGRNDSDNESEVISYQPLNHGSHKIYAVDSLVIELILDSSDLRDVQADNILVTTTFSPNSCEALDESRSNAWKIDKRFNVTKIHLIIDEGKKFLGDSTLFLCVLDTITGRFRHLGNSSRLSIER